MRNRRKKTKDVLNIFSKSKLFFLFSVLSISIIFPLSIHFDKEEIKNQDISSHAEQKNNVHFYNNINSSKQGAVLGVNEDMYADEIELSIGNSATRFDNIFILGLVNIDNKIAKINFNLDSDFDIISVGQSTFFSIGNQNYKLLITEVDNKNGYIKFKILSL